MEEGRPQKVEVGRLEDGGAGLLVQGRIWGVAVECLVDTGATINILSLAWWNKHGLQDALLPAAGRVFSADGRPMQLMGRVKTEIVIGGQSWPATFEVADVSTEAIVGSLFLRENRFLVDMAGERLIWGEGDVGGGDLGVCRVMASRTAVIAPGSEAVIDGYVVGDWLGSEEGLVEGLRDVEDERGILVGRGLISVTGEDITPVRVFNPGREAVVIYRDMTLATLEPVVAPPDEWCDGPGGVDGFCRVIRGPLPETEEETSVLDGLVSGTEEGKKEALRELLSEHKGAFQLHKHDTGRANWVEHKINTGTNYPIRQAPRRLAPHRRKLVDVEVDKMLESGTIEPAEGPWASPVVLVKKKDGSMRFCVDYRRLNGATVKDAYPLPRIDDSLDTLAGSEWFSTMDLVSGYWQVAMAEDDKEKTAFSTHRGLFQFTVMPFGLCNAPGTFERLMEVAMRGLQWTSCLVYLDDIVVFARTFESHLQRLGEVLGRLQRAGLKVKPSKCQLARREVGFLGHVVSAAGVQTDPRKVRLSGSGHRPGTSQRSRAS